MGQDLLFFRLKTFLSLEKKNILKYGIILFIIGWLIWDVAGVGKIINENLYAKVAEEEIGENFEELEDYDDFNPNAIANIKGHTIYKTFVKKLKISGTFVSHGKNKAYVEQNYPKLSAEDKEAYNDISPDNVTVIYGKNIKGAIKSCDFEQKVNVLYVKCPKDFPDGTYPNNYHIIPANNFIAKGLSILPESGEAPIYLEGFLLDWDFVKDENYAEKEKQFKTALYSGELVPHERDSDVKIRKIFQLYLTRMIYDGYEYK